MTNRPTPAPQDDPVRRLKEKMEARYRMEQAIKVRNYRTLNRTVKKQAILFTGSSLMEMFPVTEMALSAGIGVPVYNRGIGGTTTDDFLREIDTVLLDPEPEKVFINIGTNDMTDRVYGDGWMDHLERNYDEILRTVRERLPQTQVFCMAYYPTNLHLPGNDDPGVLAMLKERTPENIAECCRRVKALAEKYGYRYINVNDGLVDERGEQKAEFAIDGVHMIAEAYAIVFRNLLPYLREDCGLFLDTDDLRSDEIVLRLTRTTDPMPEKRFLPAYHFDICLPDGTKIGACDLRIGHNDKTYIGGNIGYGIDEPYRGHRYAAKACELLFRQAKKHGMDHVIITCVPTNAASARTCQLAGGRYLETADIPEDNEMYAEGKRQVMVYRFDLT